MVEGCKKVKSHVKTTDTRRTILKFKEDGTEKTIMLWYGIYDDLSLLYLEKRYDKWSWKAPDIIG